MDAAGGSSWKSFAFYAKAFMWPLLGIPTCHQKRQYKAMGGWSMVFCVRKSKINVQQAKDKKLFLRLSTSLDSVVKRRDR